MKTNLDYAIAVVIGLWPSITGNSASRENVTEAFQDSPMNITEEEIEESWERLRDSGMIGSVET